MNKSSSPLASHGAINEEKNASHVYKSCRPNLLAHLPIFTSPAGRSFDPTRNQPARIIQRGITATNGDTRQQ